MVAVISDEYLASDACDFQTKFALSLCPGNARLHKHTHTNTHEHKHTDTVLQFFDSEKKTSWNN